MVSVGTIMIGLIYAIYLGIMDSEYLHMAKREDQNEKVLYRERGPWSYILACPIKSTLKVSQARISTRRMRIKKY